MGRRKNKKKEGRSQREDREKIASKYINKGTWRMGDKDRNGRISLWSYNE